MKRVLLFLMVIAAVLIIAAGIFIATFDADRFRPQLVQKLQQATGLGVRLDRLSLGWMGGMALKLDGLAVYEGRAASGDPLVALDSASAVVRLKPLLQRRVEVSSVVLKRPRASIRRDKEGRIVLPVPPVQPGGDQPAPQGGPAQPPAPQDGAPVSFDIASVRVEDGEVHWTDGTTTPPTDVRVTRINATVADIAPGRPMDLSIEAAIGGGAINVNGSGRLHLPSAAHPGSVERLSLKLNRVALAHLPLHARPGEPHLTGLLSAAIEGDLPSLEPAALAGTASASGTLRFDEPVVQDLNILREVFQKLSILPGLLERLESRLPQDYREKLNAPDTALEPFEVPFRLAGGVVDIDELTVQSDTLGLSGRGRISTDGTLNVQALLRIDPQFSAAIIRSVEELRTLANAAGELELPLSVQGKPPQVAVMPDLQYVASKVVAATAAEAIGKLLRGGESEEPDQSQAGQPSPEGALPPAEPDPADPAALLGQFLNRALERRAPEPAAPQSTP
jgi:hypothetical protein